MAEKVQGSPCKRCGSTERYVASRNCVACTREGCRQRYATDPEYAQARRAAAKAHGQLPSSRERERIRWSKRRQDPEYLARARAQKRDRHLIKTYGIDTRQYERLLAAQGGQCALCKTDTPGGSGDCFHVDHCHATGKVRGLLCSQCNQALGKLGDTIEALERVLRYLKGLA